MSDVLERLLDAALPHVIFDGWSAASFRAAVADLGEPEALARAVAPRGALDLAAEYHRRGDRAMAAAFEAADKLGLRYSEKVALLVRLRLEAVDAEIVRRGMALFALPQHAPQGVALIWGTADAIWTALGDTSEDVNWYTKRMTLSGVFSSSVLFWLGDKSDDHQATWAFIDRRIADVMSFEGFKAKVRENPLVSKLMDSPLNPFKHIKKPQDRRADYPGYHAGR
ncbi:MAG: COQ9 family protein [Deltaproteobacteria bacterium]